jgi:hypothetical protein
MLYFRFTQNAGCLMKSLTFYLEKMNGLLDQLIEIGTALRNLSLQVVSEEELNLQQKKQKELLDELEIVDQTLQTHFWNLIAEEEHRRIHVKVHAFQTLNQEFIQNLRESHGLIQFELSHLQTEEEEVEQFSSQLNKAAFAPSRSKTIKPKKSKVDNKK